MKKASALAVLEFDDIPSGVYAVDVILKKSPIAFVRAGTVTQGRYLIVFGGSTGATGESFDEVMAMTRSSIIDYALLNDVHSDLFESVFGKRRKILGSLLIIETETASSIVRAVEAALKGTPVELIELRLSDIGLAGKGVAVLAGSLPDIDAAAFLAAEGAGADAAAPRGFSYRVIAAPHDVLEREMSATTRFDTAPMLELDGEEG